MDLLKGGVRYYFSKWAKPKKGCGPLCVFSNYEDAEIFRGDLQLFIYECLYVPSPIQNNIVWDKNYKYNEYKLPRGTVLATRVKLLKEVK